MRFQKNNPVLVTRKEKYSTARITEQKKSQQTSETAEILFSKTALFFSVQWAKDEREESKQQQFLKSESQS